MKRDDTSKRVRADRIIVLAPNGVMPLVRARLRTVSTAKLRVTITSGTHTGTTPATAK